jgi:hypothetical protein
MRHSAVGHVEQATTVLQGDDVLQSRGLGVDLAAPPVRLGHVDRSTADLA